MEGTPLTQAEREFGEKLASLIEGMSTIQEEAKSLSALGGDCKRAFLSVVESEEDRQQIEMQWPYLQMMLGLM